MLKYKLLRTDGTDAGEYECNTPVHADEVIWIGGGRRLRVLELVTPATDSA